MKSSHDGKFEYVVSYDDNDPAAIETDDTELSGGISYTESEIEAMENFFFIGSGYQHGTDVF